MADITPTSRACQAFSMSVLAREAAEAPDAVARQLVEASEAIAATVAHLVAKPPRLVVTCGRGSSDHAATYGKYLIETTLGVPVASLGPSIVSTYGVTPQLEGALFLAISQSGRSPDLIGLTKAARRGGAFVVGIINDTSSPLAAACDLVIPQCAGAETAVAATKSVICSCLALLQLVARWAAAAASQHALDASVAATPSALGGAARELEAAVAAAPRALASAAALDWSPALAPLAAATNLYVLGRGIGFATALEMALKLKEVCGLHAEAFSTAELEHGPLALVGPGFPVVALAQRDRTEPSVRDTADKLVQLGADVATTLSIEGTRRLDTPEVPPQLSPLCQLLACYRALPSLAAARGLDPDRPRHLAKVTRTT